MNAKDIVVNLLKLNGRELNGQTRLQREAYLLDRCGAKFELSFTYHYSGPYSFELADGWADAKAEDRIEIEEKLGRYDVSHLSFKQKHPDDDPDSLGKMPGCRRSCTTTEDGGGIRCRFGTRGCHRLFDARGLR